MWSYLFFFFKLASPNALWQIYAWKKIQLRNTGMEKPGPCLLFLGESIHSLRQRGRVAPGDFYELWRRGVWGREPKHVQQLEA